MLVGVVALAIAALSWEITTKIIGIVLLMVILPLSWSIKDTPENMGLKRDEAPLSFTSICCADDLSRPPPICGQ